MKNRENRFIKKLERERKLKKEKKYIKFLILLIKKKL